MVQAMAAFLDFCYLIRQPVFTPEVLDEIDATLNTYYRFREIFREAGVLERDGFPIKQHAVAHFRHLIEEYGAPNAVCTSITESKHIDAVKKPYRQSNRHNAIWQILLTNQRMDKLAAACEDFVRQGMIPPKPLAYTNLGDTGARSLDPGGGTGVEHNGMDNEKAPVVDDRDIDIDDVQVVVPSLASVGHSCKSQTGAEGARIASTSLQNILTGCQLGVRQVRPPSDIYLPEKAGMSASTTSTPLT